MSKPMTRIAVSVLLALALLIALYTVVQGGLSNELLKSEPNSAQVHVVNGLMTNLNHDRSTVAELDSAAQAELYSRPSGGGHGSGGGCEGELRVDPND